MDNPSEPSTSKEPEAEQVAGAGPQTSGLECPTCGDRFPSKASLEEHLPSHKVV